MKCTSERESVSADISKLVPHTERTFQMLYAR